MDKYLMLIMMVLIVGMVIATSKGLQDTNNLVLFYAQLAGVLAIIGYSTAKNRKRRKPKKDS